MSFSNKDHFFRCFIGSNFRYWFPMQRDVWKYRELYFKMVVKIDIISTQIFIFINNAIYTPQKDMIVKHVTCQGQAFSLTMQFTHHKKTWYWNTWHAKAKLFWFLQRIIFVQITTDDVIVNKTSLCYVLDLLILYWGLLSIFNHKQRHRI